MKKLTCVITAALTTSVAAISPTPAGAAPASGSGSGSAPRCTPARPRADFYAGGRIASKPINDDNAACTTISVSGIRDAANSADTCQTFLVALLSADGRDPTYTEPVEACSPTPRVRTVLATGVPAGVQFRVLYQIDYLEPAPQVVRYTVWH
ncbi:hypothetical protein [Actinoplanes sp. GCM10030250]|uniref:hypothetical protein n=1 Tax=Actinoplanes sp. GCM10030250 TaxID=3273376 RepID=UPI00360C622E